MRIQDLEKKDRPREKAKLYGIEKLENAEIIALILGHGVASYSALDMARSLLSRFTLKELSSLSYADFKKEKGFQDPQIFRLLGAFELGKRMIKERNKEKEIIASAKDICYLYQSEIGSLEQEIVLLLMCNKKRELIREEIIFKGSSQEIILSIKEICQHLLRYNSACFYLVHNHPLGTLCPSKNDIDTTKDLLHMVKAIQVVFLDHVILTANGYYSFHEHALL